MALISSRQPGSDSCLPLVSGIFITHSQMEPFIPGRKQKIEEMENINSISFKKNDSKKLIKLYCCLSDKTLK